MNFKKYFLVIYSGRFVRDLNSLPPPIQKRAAKTEQVFKENPFHPSLRLHKLKGKLAGQWSFSVTRSIRIIFKPQENGDMLFISIGSHAIYS